MQLFQLFGNILFKLESCQKSLYYDAFGNNLCIGFCDCYSTISCYDRTKYSLDQGAESFINNRYDWFELFKNLWIDCRVFIPYLLLKIFDIIKSKSFTYLTWLDNRPIIAIYKLNLLCYELKYSFIALYKWTSFILEL